MRKIRLEIEELAVESFDTAGQGAERRGTVHGNSAYSGWETCFTCQGTCQSGCGQTYQGTCARDATCGGMDNTCDGYQTCGVWGGYGDIPIQFC